MTRTANAPATVMSAAATSPGGIAGAPTPAAIVTDWGYKSVGPASLVGCDGPAYPCSSFLAREPDSQLRRPQPTYSQFLRVSSGVSISRQQRRYDRTLRGSAIVITPPPSRNGDAGLVCLIGPGDPALLRRRRSLAQSSRGERVQSARCRHHGLDRDHTIQRGYPPAM